MLAVTHELKTPISAAKLALQTIIRNDKPQLIPKLIDMANANILRLSRMVDQILLATKFESKFTDPVFSSLQVSELIQNSITGLELPASKRDLITIVQNEEIEFEADEYYDGHRDSKLSYECLQIRHGQYACGVTRGKI